VGKACTVGVVIDATRAYFDETKSKFVKKIKLVDDTFNSTHYSPHQKFPYITVFFYGARIEELPNPRFIGDILYMRRYHIHYTGSHLVTTTKASRDIISRLTIALGHSSTEIPILPILKNIKPHALI
jgi:hypothetical protein